ncbi:MAG: hypothetical protein EP315_03925 [Gammaproteobacteria bacterium]|nr:MAG: hypothetical protein EP315_03925 [Gammaproteobacteria bacterium]
MMHWRKNAQIVIAAWLMLLLSACGFHLRGAYEFPPQMATTHVAAVNPNSELVRALQRALRANQITLVDNPVDAGTVLRIGHETSSKRILSVDARGRAREYEIQYQIDVEVSSSDQGFTLPSQKLSLQREFLFDPEDVLGKSSEEADLLRDMQHDMVRLILLRIQARAKATDAEQ